MNACRFSVTHKQLTSGFSEMRFKSGFSKRPELGRWLPRRPKQTEATFGFDGAPTCFGAR
jgi:hypothetical protein